MQGVGFRFFVIRAASALHLRGWVRNRPDGTVELIAEGAKPDLETLLRAAREGPRGAHVTEVTADWSAAQGDLDRFDLVY